MQLRFTASVNKIKLSSFCPISVNRTNLFSFSFVSSHEDHGVPIPVNETAKQALISSSYSFVITALGGRKCDFVVSVRCLHDKAQYTRTLWRPLGEGVDMPATACQ